MRRLAFTMCVCMVGAVAEPPPCTVTQQIIPGAVLTTITLSRGSVSLTVPMFDYGIENTRLTLETRGLEKDPELKLQAGEESVAIQNGAVLHFHLKPMERLVFSVVHNEEIQCIWASELRAGDARSKAWLQKQRADFKWNNMFVHRVGDPIFLTLIHEMEQTPREFTIGGLRATVLAETQQSVILRDPQPVIGTRVVETRGQYSELHFAEIEQKWAPTSETSARLEVHGKGMPAGHWRLGIYNLSPELFTLGKGCGRIRSQDRGEGGGQDLSSRSEFNVSCEIRSKGSIPLERVRFTTMIRRF